METIFTENFTNTNGTNLSSHNSWTAKSGAWASITDLQIQSNKCAKTGNGACAGYKEVIGWSGVREARCVMSRYAGTGQRYFNQFILGSSDISSLANFQNNGIYIYIARSGSAYNNSAIYIYDGSTLVLTKTSLAFQFNGTDVQLSFVINANGSATLTLTQGGVTDTTNISARTWVKGTGNYFGFYFDHSGNDGQGQLTRSQIDSIELLKQSSVQNYNATFLNILRRV